MRGLKPNTIVTGLSSHSWVLHSISMVPTLQHLSKAFFSVVSRWLAPFILCAAPAMCRNMSPRSHNDRRHFVWKHSEETAESLFVSGCKSFRACRITPCGINPLSCPQKTKISSCDPRHRGHGSRMWTLWSLAYSFLLAGPGRNKNHATVRVPNCARVKCFASQGYMTIVLNVS